MRPESKVGIVVLAFIFVVFYFTFKIGGDRLPWQKDEGYQINAFFDSTAGLESKALVRYAGVRVGVVENIALEDGRAKVTLKLEPDVRIHRDAVFEVGSLGLMGEKYVNIRGGNADAPWLENGGSVQGNAPTSIDQLVTAINSIGGDIKVITSSLRDATGADQEKNKIKDIVDNIDRLTSVLANTAESNQQDFTTIIQNFRVISGDLKAIINSNQSDINSTISDLKTVVASLAETVPDISSNLKEITADLRILVKSNQNNLDDTITNLAAASEKLDTSMSNINDLTGKINRGEGSIGKLINTDDFHANLNTTLEDIDKTANELRGFIGGFNDYRLYFGYRGEYLSDIGETKSFVSLKVQPRPDKFYLIEMVNSPFGKLYEKEYQIDIDSPDYGSHTLDLRTKKFDHSEMTFTFQYAKIFHNLTVRGGLIESTGGFGMDYDLLNNKVSLSFDSWDFSRDEDPHFKLGGKLRFGENFYLSGGWDDFLLHNQSEDNIYFGAGFYIEDQDLKSLLGFLPLVSGS